MPDNFAGTICLLIVGTIFFMDNLDDMMKSRDTKARLLYFLDRFSSDIRALDTEVSMIYYCFLEL
jgi:hypothetical protein